MIRSALFALGLSAGAATAQAGVPSTATLEVCGGARLVLSAQGAPEADELDQASDVINARFNAMVQQTFDYSKVHASVQDGIIHVDFADGLTPDAAAIEPLLARIGFGFHAIHKASSTGLPVDLAEGEILLPYLVNPTASYVVQSVPFLDASMIVQATLSIDDAALPTIPYVLSDEGRAILAAYTTVNIGSPVAIVVSDQILSAKFIRAPNSSGSGLIQSNGAGLKHSALSVEETAILAANLQGGVVPFDLEIVDEIRVDGSNPSADFCP